MFRSSAQRLIAILIALLAVPTLIAAAQSSEWLTYSDPVAGFAFEYPSNAHLSTGLDASQGNSSVFVSIGAGQEYQGYSIAVLNNGRNLALDQFLIELLHLDTAQSKRLNLNGLEAIQQPATGADQAEAYWVQLDRVVLKIELYRGDGSIEITPDSRAAFDRALATLRSIPQSQTIAPSSIAPNVPNIGIADQFQAPLATATTIQYETQWNVITSDTRYGVRNLALTGRKCFGVAWNRMLHSAIDLYRLDGQSADGTSVVAVADGQVAYYDSSYASYPGHVVIIRHQLADSSLIYSVYAHMNAVYIYQGQNVIRGQPIGTVLYQPNDSHLHFEMRKFLDGTYIYTGYPACNGIIYGRGYTYQIHPDNFPAPNGYINPDAFIQAHGGSPLTPIGLPDAYGPLLTYSTLNASTSIDQAQPITDSPSMTHTAYFPLIVREYPKREPACVEGQNLLTNSGFEDGVGSAPWVQVRNSTADSIDANWPYSGVYSVWLGGRNLADEEALQSFVVPYYTDGITLTFKRYLTTQETALNTVYDHFEVVLENTVGNEISPQLQFSNLSTKNVWMAESAAFDGAQAWTGQRLRLSIKGMTDGSLPSSFFVDEVSVQTRCAP
ncbi:MAG TPA: M23 family metallopeptidase [Anaerolineae bacterium]|nr:M23 family metallopeptidase [Anaerolineae bacterium]